MTQAVLLKQRRVQPMALQRKLLKATLRALVVRHKTRPERLPKAPKTPLMKLKTALMTLLVKLKKALKTLLVKLRKAPRTLPVKLKKVLKTLLVKLKKVLKTLLVTLKKAWEMLCPRTSRTAWKTSKAQLKTPLKALQSTCRCSRDFKLVKAERF